MLLSVRPRFAEAILAGTKSAEIRRQRPAAQPGMPVILYATKPLGAVIGTAHIDSIRYGTPADLWERHHDQVGVTQEEFDQYLHGASTAYLLMLTETHRLPCPLTLEDMRETVAFQPPRSYRYLNSTTLRAIVNGHPGGASLMSLLHA